MSMTLSGRVVLVGYLVGMSTQVEGAPVFFDFEPNDPIEQLVDSANPNNGFYDASGNPKSPCNGGEAFGQCSFTDFSSQGIKFTNFWATPANVTFPASSGGNNLKTFAGPGATTSFEATQQAFTDVVATVSNNDFGRITVVGNMGTQTLPVSPGTNRRLTLDGAVLGGIQRVEFDDSFFSIDELEVTTPSVADLFLDFSGVSAQILTLPDPSLGRDRSVVRPGSMPGSVFSPTQEGLIVQGVQEILTTSGLNINVTANRPSGDFLTVEFGRRVTGDFDGNPATLEPLYGIAYDVLPASRQGNGGADRYDLRKDGKVAAFLEPSDDFLLIVETVLHEAGHAYGLRHIDPLPGGSEVMDYTDPDLTTGLAFYNMPADIIADFGPPVRTLNEEHNPLYHLRRYVNGDTLDSLASSSLSPGGYDERGFTIFGINISNLFITDSVFDLSIGNGAPRALDDPLGVAQYLEGSLISGDSLFLELVEGETYQLFGSSVADGNVLDVFFGYGSVDNPILEIDLSVLDDLGRGTIFMWDPLSGAFIDIGGYDFEIAYAENISNDGAVTRVPQSVPAPSGFLLVSVFGLALLAFRNRYMLRSIDR